MNNLQLLQNARVRLIRKDISINCFSHLSKRVLQIRQSSLPTVVARLQSDSIPGGRVILSC
jgi:hypothetical protein